MSFRIMDKGIGDKGHKTPQEALLLELENRPTIHRECIDYIDKLRDAMPKPKWSRVKPLYKEGY